jgi:transcriptional regulator with XRE-family HTH domain
MKDEIKKEMGLCLTRQRTKVRYKQKDLAEFLGCNPVSISMWERGMRQIPLKHFIRIPILLECKLDDLSPTKEFLKCQHK